MKGKEGGRNGHCYTGRGRVYLYVVCDFVMCGLLRIDNRAANLRDVREGGR